VASVTLSLVKLRAMGGDVVAHSDGEGHGSRFEFFLPVNL
jgi:signal transduction histidine kinase